MRVKFKKDYLPILAAFMAKQDVRYYLNGFHVKPHPEQGVILTATDGHRLVTIHDEEGLVDGEYIFPISKNLLAASKKRPDKKGAFTSHWVQYIDNRFIVCSELENHTEEGFLVDDTFYQAAVQYIEYVPHIDGIYPDVGAVIEKLKPQPTDVCAFNVKYIADLQSIYFSKRMPIVDIVLCGKDNAFMAIGGTKREIIAAVIPARGNYNSIDDFVKPSFAKFAGHKKTQEKENEQNNNS